MIPMGRSMNKEREMRFLGEMALGFCHNLRSPLSVILMNAELIRLADGHNAKIKKYAQTIVDQADKLNTLIDQITEKVIQDRKNEEGWMDINALFQSELGLFENNLFFKHQVTKDVQFDESCPMIHGVRRDFSQALSKIIKKALDAMIDSEEKRLTAKSIYQNGRIVLEVRNTYGRSVERERSRAFSAPGDEILGKDRDPRLGLDCSEIRRLKDRYGVTVDVIHDLDAMIFRLIIPTEQAHGARGGKVLTERDR